MRDEGYREIHLTGKQLVFLFMAATVVAVVIFLLGVLVGRGVQAERDTGAGSTLVSAPQIVPDAAPATSPENSVVNAQADTRPVAAPPPVDESGNANKVEGKAPALEAAARPEHAAAGARGAVKEPAAAAKGATPARPATSSAQQAASEGAGDGYAVQVVAVKTRAEADAIVKRLASKGYRAYVFAPKGKAPAGMFRVRVGTFPSLNEAKAASQKLEKEEQYKPWIIR
jgi:cell division septation protein DedD